MTITQQRLKELFNCSEDGKLIRKLKTSNKVNVGEIVGSNNGNGYLRTSINFKSYHIHRLVFMWHHGYFPKEIDHINGNRSDNRIENLRSVTHSQNGKNIKTRNSIGINGIRWEESRSKWNVSIGVDKKKIHLGRFKNLNDAIDARKVAEIQFFKEWRRNALCG